AVGGVDPESDGRRCRPGPRRSTTSRIGSPDDRGTEPVDGDVADVDSRRLDVVIKRARAGDGLDARAGRQSRQPAGSCANIVWRKPAEAGGRQMAGDQAARADSRRTN